MQFEVEQKFSVPDLTAVESRLQAIGARFHAPVKQVDRCFDHPARSFAKTDEAFRIRQVNGENFITYKGPKLDPITKTRHEIELPLHPGEEYLEQFTSMLELLGFSIMAQVTKMRHSAEVSRSGWTVTVALDNVEHLGTFVELEVLTNASEVESARSAVLSLAAELGLTQVERRSYLELLLRSRM